MRFHFGALQVPVAVLLASPRSVAADEAHTFDVAYIAPGGCPESPDFVVQILSRTDRARRSTDSPEFLFTLRVSDTPDGPRGALFVREPGQAESRREVPGDDCASVVEAAALIASLILDPHATTGTIAPEPSSDASSSDAPSSPPAGDALAPSFGERRGTTSREPSWRFGVGAASTVQAAVAPSMAPGASLGLRVSSGDASVVAPMFGLEGQVAASSASAAGGSATFTWLAVRTWACPIRIPAEPTPVAFLPCAFFDAGTLKAVGDDALQLQNSTAAWLALGALARAEWTIASAIALELQAGATIPFNRDSYVFLPDLVIHTVPPVGFSGALGVIFWIR